MPTRLHFVNFGRVKTGLSPSYAVYNSDLTVKSAATTTGVSELGSTGIYAAKITLDIGFDGLILWSTEEATPRYGVESTESYLTSVKEGTDDVRIIRNTIQNQANYQSEILTRLKRGVLDPNDPVMSSLRHMIEGVSQRIATTDQLSALFSQAASKVNLSLSAPDMTPILDNIRKEMVSGIKSLPKQPGITKAEFDRQISHVVRELKRWMLDTNKLIMDQRLAPLSKPRDVMSAAEVTARRIDENTVRLNKAILAASSGKATSSDLRAIQRASEASSEAMKRFSEEFAGFTQTMASMQDMSNRLASLIELIMRTFPDIQATSAKRDSIMRFVEAM